MAVHAVQLVMVLSLAIVAMACSTGGQVTTSPSPAGSTSIVGTWKCGPPDSPGQDTVEIKADGTVTITQPGTSPTLLTWSVQGTRGSFKAPAGEDPFEDPFTVETARIVFDDGFVCTPAT